MQWQELRSHLRHLSEADLKRVQAAFLLGQRAHDGQLRKSGEPYFSHPIAIAHMLAAMGGDADTVIAALLHDTVEDTEVSLAHIRAEFGETVSGIIDGLTKLERSDLDNRPSLDEQVESLRKMFTLMQQDVRIMVIKLVDRLHNMQTVGFLSPERQRSMAQETLDVYVKIADRLSMQDLRDELERLCHGVLHPTEHEHILKLRIDNERRANAVIGILQNRLAAEQHGTQPAQVRQEYKTWDELQKQLDRGSMPATGMPDIIVVFICENVDQCYITLGFLHSHWPRETLSFQDYINAPLQNGYQGIHTTVILEDGTRVRCKIRTDAMHRFARNGVAEYCFDQEAKGLLEYFPWVRRITTVSEDTAERSDSFWESLQHDILGESIIVHSPDGKAFSVPRNASALDGAFYIAEKHALRLESILINGHSRPFGMTLRHGDTLSFTFARRPTVDRGWLQWVETSVAAAAIRSALAGEGAQKQREQGRKLLQETMTASGRGYIEEFDETALKPRLETLGTTTFDALFVDIANGKVDVDHAHAVLFGVPQIGHEERRRSFVVMFRNETDDDDAARELYQYLRSKKMLIQEQRHIEKSGATKLQLFATHEETQEILHDLESIGMRGIRIIERSPSQMALLCTIIFLWGLNPVVAVWLLQRGLTPVHLLSVRLLTIGILSIAFFAVWRSVSSTHLRPVKRLWLLSFPPALLSLFLAAFTYQALVSVPPSLHLTILRFNVLILPIVHWIWTKRNNRVLLLTAVSGGLLMLLGLLPSFDTSQGIVFSVIALCSYTLYSISLEETLQRFKIGRRYPLLMLYTGIYLGLFGAGLAILQPQNVGWNIETLAIAAYSMLFVFVPHACFYAMLRRQQFRNVTDPFVFEIPIAVVAEAAVLHLAVSPVLYAFVTCAIGAVVLLRLRQQSLLFL